MEDVAHVTRRSSIMKIAVGLFFVTFAVSLWAGGIRGNSKPLPVVDAWKGIAGNNFSGKRGQ